MNKNQITIASVTIFSVLLSLVGPVQVSAAYDTYAPGVPVTLGEFVYDDDYTPSTADCTVTVYDPTGAVEVNAAPMLEEASGWHYYTFTPSGPDGTWPATMTCGAAITGDLVTGDKTFIIGTPEVAVDETAISNSVWANATRTLTSATGIAGDIWSYSTRTISSFGALAADVWNSAFAPTRRLTDSTLSGGGTLGTETFINSSIDTRLDAAESSIITEILENRTLIENLNNLSAADVWAHGARSLTSAVDISSASQQAIWDVASADLITNGSVGQQLVTNLNAQISSRGTSNLTAADVWNAATRTLSDYSEDSVALAVWADSSRTLTNYGNDITAEEVWDVLSTSLDTVGSIGEQVATNLDVAVSTRATAVVAQDGWSVQMSNVERIQTGRTYRAKVVILDSSATPTAPFATPTITLYDASRNMVVSSVPMTSIGTGIYEYTYSVAGAAEQGLWESVIATEVESGKTVSTNDYWEVSGSPAQVLINSMADVTTPEVSANITITNEGLTGYEYQYEWCVVTDASNACGGGDDTYHATAAKFINPGEDFNTTLTATVPSTGNYLFKLVVYFGTEKSGASRTFTATSGSTPPSSGGGGGGGGSSTPKPPVTPPAGGFLRSDINLDKIVNSIDFSILLAFWKTAPPFRQPRADINTDNEVNSVDFSIMLFEWGKTSQ